MENQQSGIASSEKPSTNKLGMFDRRINRTGFLLAYPYLLLPLLIPIFLQLVIVGHSSDSAHPTGLTAIVNIFSLLISLVILILFMPAGISVYVRRLHDINQSGSWAFLVLVPFLSALLWLYLVFAPGTKESNKYGMPVKSLNYWVVLGFKRP
ncbi:MAG TPA: DUF805 domain-containing protein [Patescibacteria group bacterium]|nr:DUF805 domain-containing protein [Patescibacteria group bacterium]